MVVGWEERACELTNPAPVRADLASTPHPEQSSDRALPVWGRQAGLERLLASLALNVAYSNHCCEKKQKQGRGVYFGARFKKAWWGKGVGSWSQEVRPSGSREMCSDTQFTFPSSVQHPSPEPGATVRRVFFFHLNLLNVNYF